MEISGTSGAYLIDHGKFEIQKLIIISIIAQCHFVAAWKIDQFLINQFRFLFRMSNNCLKQNV